MCAILVLLKSGLYLNRFCRYRTIIVIQSAVKSACITHILVEISTLGVIGGFVVSTFVRYFLHQLDLKM